MGGVLSLLTATQNVIAELINLTKPSTNSRNLTLNDLLGRARKEMDMENQNCCNERADVVPQPSGTLNLNQATYATDEQIADIMAYHPWDADKIKKGQAVRDVLGAALKVIIEVVPPSPDRSVAIRKIRDARMDCNSAITHNGKY